MPLKTLVKVGKITNLSDARYCSGMGVDMLGFQAIEGHEGFIMPAVFQEIRGWISGPKIVVELYGLPNAALLPKIIEDYRPDYLEVSMTELRLIAGQTTIPLIVSLDKNVVDDIGKSKDSSIAFIQVSGELDDSIHTLSQKYGIIVSLTSSENLNELLELPIKGISLYRSKEIRPGFKEYTGLAEILEELDAD